MRDYYYHDLYQLKRFNGAKINWINTIGLMTDIQSELEKLRKKSKSGDRLLITYYNHIWEPILNLATFLGWRKKIHQQNWLDSTDLKNLLELSGWQIINSGKRLLLPINVPLISSLVNDWLANLPIVNSFCLTTWVVAKVKSPPQSNLTVSIIVPARNEEGNVHNLLKRLPFFGKWQEIIFVEGHSQDNTLRALNQLRSQSTPKRKIFVYRQRGIGKADAVRLGFNRARGDVLMILDADLSVNPHDLLKFYTAISSGSGEFINGCRLVYPLAEDAMQSLNKLMNKIFSWLFTWILGQHFKDTLCGTKVFFKKDYQRMRRLRQYFGKIDPFGDFDLIFAAVKLNLKVVEIPVRYWPRSYGSTNINRFRHGWLLLKMTIVAFQKFKLFTDS